VSGARIAWWSLRRWFPNAWPCTFLLGCSDLIGIHPLHENIGVPPSVENSPGTEVVMVASPPTIPTTPDMAHAVAADGTPVVGSESLMTPVQASGHYRFGRGSATYRVEASAGILAALEGSAVELRAGIYGTARGGKVLLAATGSFEFTPASSTFWGDDYFDYASDLAHIRVRLTVQPQADIKVLDLGRGLGNGFRIDGSGNFGRSIANAGDVNGDGLADFVIGESATVASAAASCLTEVDHEPGAAHVLFGRKDTSSISIASIDEGAGVGFSIRGSGEADAAGSSVAGAGDVNGDGLDDVLVGAPFAGAGTFGSGAVYLAFGGVDSSTIRPEVLPSGICAADSATPAMIMGQPTSSIQLGRAVAGAGDINGDGLADMILGAPCFRDTAYILGEAFVAYGQQRGCLSSALDTDDTAPAFRVTGEKGGSYAGDAVQSIGDFNGDGLDDFSVTGSSAYIIFGAKEKPPWRPFGVMLYGSTSMVAEITGDEYLTVAHADVAAAGDVNGDGFADVLVRSVSYDAPEVFVVFGRAGRGPVSLEEIRLGLRGGFEIGGLTDPTTAAGVGDIDGDGLDDIVVASAVAETTHMAYAILGKTSFDSVTLSSLEANRELGFRVQNTYGDGAGNAIAGGDVNGDGIDDILLAAAPADSTLDSGSAYVLFGWDANNALGERVFVDLRGPGDDTLDYPALPFVRLSGGHGLDTLRVLGRDRVIDLRGVAPRLRSIESIDITGDGPNRVIIDETVLRRVPESRGGLPGNLAKMLVVVGDADDTVQMDLSEYDVVDNQNGLVYERIGQYFGVKLAGPSLD